MSKHIVITSCEFCPFAKLIPQWEKCKETGSRIRDASKVNDDCPLEDYNPQYATIDNSGKLVRVFVEAQKEESE